MEPFNIFVGVPSSVNAALLAKEEGLTVLSYCSSITSELRRSARDRTWHDRAVKSVYFSGCPSLQLSHNFFATVLGAVYDLFPRTSNPEVTLQIDTQQVFFTGLQRAQRDGVTRVRLKPSAEGRIARQNFLKAVETIRLAKFKSLSTALVYDEACSSLESFREKLLYVTEFDPEHINCIVGANSKALPLLRGWNRKDLFEYKQLFDDSLNGLGYEQCGLLSFAKPGHAPIYSRLAWHSDEFLGVGVGALTRMRRQNYSCLELQNATDVRDYLERTKSKGNAVVATRKFNAQALLKEYVSNQLLSTQGLSLTELEKMNSKGLITYDPTAIDALLEDHYLESHGEWIRLTHKGLLVFTNVAGSISQAC
ncbi:MAG: hypothetical protein KDD42_05515 [Bdellovibrionales bacterium]|nr:hypothetical protein [Bdellovibrionales bacterium]